MDYVLFLLGILDFQKGKAEIRLLKSGICYYLAFGISDFLKLGFFVAHLNKNVWQILGYVPTNYGRY